jgi:hypothetical protein
MREMRTQDSVKNYMSEKIGAVGFIDWLGRCMRRIITARC